MADQIKDYGVIGNGRSAALVSKKGSIDWLCWPRFDSPSLFGALLDEEKGGHFKIAPTHHTEIQREYIEATNVLQTTFSTPSQKLLLIDFMSVTSEEEKKHSLQPEQELVRSVECVLGEIEIEVTFIPRPNYGKKRVKIIDAGKFGLRIEVGSQLFTLRSDTKLNVEGRRGYAKIKLKKGQKLNFSLTYSRDAPATLPPLDAHKRFDQTVAWWQQWSKKCTYEGPFKHEVIRSLLTLKLLGYAPSGAIVAAPTTSLPEKKGGVLNWDYRYCWLRDAAFTVKALFNTGFKEEAEAFVNWLLHSTRLTLPELAVLYDVYGIEVADETNLSHLAGYKNSTPVKIGNRAARFLELDVYGEVIEAVTYLSQERKPLDRDTQKMLRKLGEFVCKHWREPDTGIWEEPHLKHFTHSKLMCWVALDRLLNLQKEGKIKISLEKIEREWKLLRKEIEERGWNDKIEAYTQAFAGETVDASILEMALYDFEAPNSEKMQKSFRRIKEQLQPSLGLLYRYERSPYDGEGAFGLCSFWMVEFLAKGGGTFKEAEVYFKAALSYANDLGLFSEEIDPKSGKLVGNFPQGFTHIGVINAALALNEREALRE